LWKRAGHPTIAVPPGTAATSVAAATSGTAAEADGGDARAAASSDSTATVRMYPHFSETSHESRRQIVLQFSYSRWEGDASFKISHSGKSTAAAEEATLPKVASTVIIITIAVSRGLVRSGDAADDDFRAVVLLVLLFSEMEGAAIVPEAVVTEGPLTFGVDSSSSPEKWTLVLVLVVRS